MRRALFGLAAVASAVGLLRLRCALRGKHAPVRHFLGAFRCSLCGTPGTDLEQMGVMDGGGFVSPMRRTFGRRREEGYTREYVQ